MSLTPGTRIGPYEITGHLGSGGMGEVHQAADTTLNRDVALKRLPAAVSADADRIARRVVGADALLYKGDARESPASWSRNYLTFEANGDIWALPSGGDGQPIRVTETPFAEGSSQISPDGRWVAHVSNEPGSDQVFVQSFPEPGVKRQVSSAGGSSPRWSRDGRELFYISPTRQMMAAPIMATGTSFDSGAPTALFEVHVTSTGEANYAVSADGRFLVNVPDEDRSAHPVTVILNWMSGPAR